MNKVEEAKRFLNKEPLVVPPSTKKYVSLMTKKWEQRQDIKSQEENIIVEDK